MDEITLKEGLILVKKFDKLPPKDRDTLRRQRLYNMVTYAKEQSPLYAEHYKNLPENFLLRDVPPINIEKLKKNPEKWACENIVPNEIYASINTERTFSNDRDYRSFLLHGSRCVIISAIEESPFLASWRKSTTVLSVFLPLDDIVESLNQLKPAYLWVYPSTLEKLVDAWELYKLNIKPSLIIAGGEPLSDDLRERASATFNCNVQNSYSTKEAGVIAFECNAGHLHVNDDWIIVEPVDSSGKAVLDGITSDAVYVTNLYKTDTPLIRAKMSDHVTMHSEGCPCGKISPWITVEAGIDEFITFNSYGKNIDIPFSDFEEVFEKTKEILGYQLLFYAGNNVSVRLDVKPNANRPLVFLNIESKLRRFFHDKGVVIGAITMDADGTLLDENNGKFKNIIDCR